ncbi:MAG TPA: hypothetical protein VJR29_07330 [bacterium]|nr:hypothetical protein [bacterium]
MSISVLSIRPASLFGAAEHMDTRRPAQPTAGKYSENVGVLTRKPRVLDCNNPFKEGPPCRAMPPLWRQPKPPRQLDRTNPFDDLPKRKLDTENPYA